LKIKLISLCYSR